jgi:hypothetical protein
MASAAAFKQPMIHDCGGKCYTTQVGASKEKRARVAGRTRAVTDFFDGRADRTLLGSRFSVRSET